MKKLLLASAIALGISSWTIALPATQTEAHAKEYTMKKNLANHVKKGTFPRAKGKVGSLKKNLALKNVNNSWQDPVLLSGTYLNDSYIFNSSNVTPNSKVVLIERSYDYLISNASIRKYLGKELKLKKAKNSYDGTHYSFYKAGKHYVGVTKFARGYIVYTMLTVGTKSATADYYDIKFY